MKKTISARLSDQEYEFVFRRTPRICLDFIVMADNKMLLTKRNIAPYKNLYHFPGGRVFYKESIAQATQRILGCELGIKINAEPILAGYMEFPNDGEYVHSISMVYVIELASEKIAEIKIDEQAKKYKFFDRLPSKMHPIHKKFAIKFM